MRHLIDITDLTIDEIDSILLSARDIINNGSKYAEAMRGKKLATLFFEPSTRTRLSFEAAMLELGGSVLGFSEANSSSAAKGESVCDTVRTVGCYADIIAMRHPKEGAPKAAAARSTVPVINAGDGGHCHPTQTLTDLMTIKAEKGGFSGLTVGLCGDLKFGRTVHSLLNALSRYDDINFVLISPDELRAPDYVTDMLDERGAKWSSTSSMDEVMPQLDILYMTRVQKERFFNEADYIRLKDTFVLTRTKLEAAKKDMRVMHPLPRVNEISRDVDDDPRAAYFRQVYYGKIVRMALIMWMLEAAK